MDVTVLWSHRTDLPGQPASVRQARDFVGAHLGEHQLPYLIDDIRLVVSELATNATLHARTPFTVTLDGLPDSVLLSVQDDSPSIPTTRNPPVMATAGRGLSIVDRVSRDWGITTPGPQRPKTVWASFDLRHQRLRARREGEQPRP
jgi:anti-sigma regulatory factor (Ser/Thr protein kinase)